MKLPTIDDIDLKDKRVMLRLDFDYLFKSGFEITEYHELNLVIPTIEKLITENARIVIAASFKNSGKFKDFEYPMEKFANIFCDILKCEVYLTEDREGSVVNKISQEMVQGGILILNNFSDYPDDTGNNQDFAKSLSESADIYVNEAITLSHLKLASTNSILDYLDRDKICVGPHFEYEYKIMKLIRRNERPSALIVNTSNVNEGIELIEKLVDEFDKVLLIGKISNLISDINAGVCDKDIPKDLKDKVECLIKSLAVRNVKLFHSSDFYIEQADSKPKLVKKDFPDNDHNVLDIGESTGSLFSDAISDVKKLVWCGEIPVKSDLYINGGTSQIFDTVKENSITSVLLVSEPVIDYLKYKDIGDYINLTRTYDTTINYICRETLPAIESIEGKFS